MHSTIGTTTQPHPQNGQPEKSSVVANMFERTDDLLQLSRRVDWRFLLPAPSLGKVAFVGSEGSTHFKALRHFCGSLTHFESTADVENGISQQAFDLVVIDAGKAGKLNFAKNLLKHGGFVYWEIDRKEYFKRGQRAAAFRHFDCFVKQAIKAGFGEIEVFWHRPNFNSCLEIIPLDDRVSMAAVFSKRGGNLKKQMKFWVGKLLWKSGFLRRVAPCVSIVARSCEMESG